MIQLNSFRRLAGTEAMIWLSGWKRLGSSRKASSNDGVNTEREEFGLEEKARLGKVLIRAPRLVVARRR